ncbi:DUF4041 domain-containing protein [Brooklawnia cerclae]|uniref:Bacteriophage T5 Orf172 DNA-binding domain-containing protein n=1 Tax=Brooklawnia cerclae TaxID=349934 RepID=A0ABX0SCI2_9ACTN|nr:DUF4041 domain-containing protein [Brooklawnia cerclae]NIH56090.1 hypothetical protein [Brooklawnia cerclae]
MGLFDGGKQKRISELEAEIGRYQTANQEMAQRVQELGGGDYLGFKRAIDHVQAEHAHLAQEQAAAEAQLADVQAQTAKVRAELVGAQVKRDELRAEAGILAEKVALQSDGLYEYEHPAESVIRLQDELRDVTSRAKSMVSRKVATSAIANFTFNNSEAKGRKFVADMSKLMLRSYNAEVENCVLTVKAGKLDTALARLQRAKDQAERLGSMIHLTINNEYHRLRCRELELSSQVADAKQAQKEAEAEERARLREEKKAQQELERERERLKKEQAHYQTVLDELRAQGRADEAAEMEARLADIGKAIDNVDYRAANIRAGYVYVISNVGAFGPSMVKIGMTRRLDPLDRVRELSDASVPFNFDVHALFFSEDAVGVEAELHRRFAAQRVNLVNARREFFAVTPAQVKQQLATIAGNLLEFVDEPEAEQYRESQRLREDGPVAIPA